MDRFKGGDLHSGKNGKVVTDKKQALAIALSACGKSRYAEVLSSLGYSEETASLVVAMFAEMDWQKNFETGKSPAPENPEDEHTGIKSAKDITQGAQKKKNSAEEMLSGPALPKGPGNPQGGSSKDVQGMRQFAETPANPLLGQCNQKKKREQNKKPRTPAQAEADKKRTQAARNNIDPGARSEAAKKAAATRAKCKGLPTNV